MDSQCTLLSIKHALLHVLTGKKFSTTRDYAARMRTEMDEWPVLNLTLDRFQPHSFSPILADPPKDMPNLLVQ